MPSLSVNSKRGLVIVLVAAAAIASAAITWKVGHDYDQRREADQMRSLGFGVRPTPLWTLDVSRLTSNPGEVLLPVSTPDTTTNGSGMVLDSSGDLIAAVGQPREFNTVADVTLVGIARGDGAPTWKRAVGPVKNCTASRVGKSIACWSPTRVIIVDTTSGLVRSDITTDFDVREVQILDGTVFISGTRTLAGSQSVIFGSGTLDAPMSRFRRSFESRGTDAHVSEIVPAADVFTVTMNVGGPTYYKGRLHYRTTAYEVESGAQRFTFDGDLHIVGDGFFRATSFSSGEESLLDRQGALIAQRGEPSREVPANELLTAASFVPMFRGASASDPRSGALLWYDSILQTDSNAASAVIAVIGNLVIVASQVERVIAGLEARTGRRTWTTPWADGPQVYSEITDGRYLIYSDYTGMHSIDTTDGRKAWTVKTPPGFDPMHVTVSTAGGDILYSTPNSVSVWRARTGPDPA